MSKLISGKEAAIAWLDGLEIQVRHLEKKWDDFSPYYYGLEVFKSESHSFRLKPRTITINGIEVPAPFEPKVGEYVYFISSDEIKGYAETTLENTPMNWGFVQFGAWRSEEEIKQVVAALRKVFEVQP